MSGDVVWANNDIYTAFIPYSGQALDHEERVTGDLSMATSLRLVPTPNGSLLIWSGRRHVGKHIDKTAAPTQIFYSMLSN